MDIKSIIEKRASLKKKVISNDEYRILELRRYALVYKRLSTYEQVHTSRYSMERQNRLEDVAISDGYKVGLTPEQILEIKGKVDYPGFYQNGRVIVIEMDLGLSGTLGQKDRPGLAMMIDLIQKDLIESIYIVEVSRIFRDCNMISAPAFALLCKEHGVIIVVEG